MKKLKLTLLGTVVYAVALIVAYAGYNLGVTFARDIMHVPFTFTVMLIGVMFAFAANFAVAKLAQPLLYIIKCGIIYIECNPDSEDGVFKILALVTCNWKETFTIPVINVLIRKVVSSIYEKLFSNPDSVPEFLQEVSRYPLFKACKSLIILSLDYVDECVTAWCYMHNDYLFTECIDGIAAFFRHSFKMTMQMMSIMFIRVVTDIMLAVVLWIALINPDSLIRSIILFYVAWQFAMYLSHEAVFNHIAVSSMVHQYIASNKKDEEKKDDGIVESLKSYADFTELENILRRFTDNGKQDGYSDESAEDLEQ